MLSIWMGEIRVRMRALYRRKIGLLSSGTPDKLQTRGPSILGNLKAHRGTSTRVPWDESSGVRKIILHSLT